ncbi:hypothetical protein EG329_000876 [Mollisiaceae sp. DMI_Dod_QoI]|nr:hypothetical protein EG329_000876 [Helotiales sp. DMI_Dod_QoI]
MSGNSGLQAACYGIVSTFFVASTFTIILRIYSRGFVVKSFGWDDWCMSSILLFNCGQQVILYYFLHYGGGLHVEDVLTTHPEWVTKLTYALFVEELYYVLMHWVIKMAFLLFYLRFATKRFRTLVLCTMGLNTLFTLIQWLLYCLQCIPLDTFFHPAAHPTVKCLDNKILAFVPAALSIFTDICIVILPIQPLWRIQVSLVKRITLLSIVSLGGVVVLISILRLTVLLEFQKMTDFTYSLGKIIIISCIELEVAIMAANAPSLKILFARASSNQSSQGTSTQRYGRSNFSKHQDMPGFVMTSSTCHITSSGATRNELEKPINSSQEALAKEFVFNENGIIVTSSVGVESHSARNSQGDGDARANADMV